MALIIANRVKETTTTTGTGALTLAGAMTGFSAFSSRMSSPSDTCYYTIQAVDGSGAPTGDWECGLGTYSAANTLTRTTVKQSSNSDAAVSFSAGTKQVWIDLEASQYANQFASPAGIGTTTANTGKFTTLQATGAITPSSTAGIVGTTAADDAVTGSVGEYITATGTAVSLTTVTNANVASVTLPAGDWEVTGSLVFDGAATTQTIVWKGGISTTSATLPSQENMGRLYFGTLATTYTGSTSISVPVIPTRVNVSSSTTVYLVAQANFSTSTQTATGIIRARRVR